MKFQLRKRWKEYNFSTIDVISSNKHDWLFKSENFIDQLIVGPVVHNGA